MIEAPVSAGDRLSGDTAAEEDHGSLSSSDESDTVISRTREGSPTVAEGQRVS